MASYRERVVADLDRWIAGGLVSADKRAAILATLPETRRVDAATALAWIGGVLLGIAALAFISANWDELPRLARFALVLALFLGAAGAGAWASSRKRALMTDIALTLAAILFAAAIGLTGQIFDIVGDTQIACYVAGVAAFALAFAGRSIGAACAALVLIGLGDLAGEGLGGALFRPTEFPAPLMTLAAPLGGWLAIRWRAAPLAHLSALGVIYAVFWLVSRAHGGYPLLLAIAALFAGLAAAARWFYVKDQHFAGVFYGWFAAAAFAFFIPAGFTSLHGDSYDGHGLGIPHRIVWLAASGGVVALGRFDRHTLITFIGVLSMLGAIAVLLSDLGLDLMSAAAVFLVCAVIAMLAGLALKRRPKAS